MKKNVFTLITFLLIYSSAQAQLGAPKAIQEKTKMYVPGTACKQCNDILVNGKNIPPSVQNGNQSVNVSYSITSCGLNYTAGSVVLEQRTNNGGFTAPVGKTQPAAITISGIPSGSVILKAFLYTALISSTNTAITLNLANPAGTSASYSMAMIGQDVSPCWGSASYQSAYTYRADVTSIVTGNGAYSLSGLPVYPNSGYNDVEGATLIIIYSDPSSGYTGTMIIADGGQVNTGNNIATTGTITGFNINANSTYANSFMLISDLQEDADATFSINGSSGTIVSAVQDWWNYAQINTSFTAGQTSCTYQATDNGDDCYFISAVGLYYQSNTPSNSNLPTSNLVQCNNFIADTLNAGSGFSTYQWSTGATTQTVVINNPGTYWVKTGNANGCIVTDTIKASVITPANVHVLRDTTVCSSNGSYTANATYNGAQSYKWYDGSTNPIKTFTASGTYSLNIYFAGGCVVTNTFNLTINTIPHVNLGNDTIICGSIINPITLNAGAGPGYSYHWSTGASTQTISVTSGGTYSVNVTSSNGCSATDAIIITVINANSLQTFDTSVCSSSSFPLILKAPNLPNSSNNYYYWSNGPSGLTTTVYYPSTIFLTIYVNGGACTLTNTYVVSLDTAKPHIPNVVECNFFEPDSVTAGYQFASYLWSTGVTTYSTVINNPGVYWVKTTSFGGCIQTDTFKAAVINPASVHVLKDTLVCLTNYNYYYYANAYINGAQSYLWYDGFTTSPYHFFSSSGNYWVNISFSKGCVVKDSFHLTLGQAPVVNLGNDEAICGIPTAPIILDAGGFGSYHYLWSTGAVSEGIQVTSSGHYWVTVSNNEGCKTSDTVNIQIFPYGNSTYVYDTLICNRNPPFILSTNVPGYNNVYWSNGYYGQYDYIYSAGTYYATVDVGGNNMCTVTDTFHVSAGYIYKPVIPNMVQCNTNTPDILDAGPGYNTYNWSTGQTTQSITVNTSGNYIVTVSNGTGCLAKDTIIVSYNTSPIINILKDTAVCNQATVTIDASYPGTNSYMWNDGYNGPVRTIGYGNYWVVYTLSTTCIATDSFNVAIKQVKDIEELPNIVTPNNDGKNDFIDFGVYQFPNIQLSIFNRWGIKVFESQDPKCVWSPVNADDGTYFYVVNYTSDCDVSKKTKTLKGFITILK